MNAELILFFGLAIVAIASGLGMLLSRNAIYSALNLIINFVTVAIFYFQLSAPFIALTQVTVYAGAIMVLFLFVIMLLGAEQLRAADHISWQRPVAFLLAVLLLILVGFAIITQTSLQVAPNQLPTGFGSPMSVALSLFTAYLLPVEVISLLLLAAMVGAIVLSRKRDGSS